jgi:hypothetical protein
MDLKTRFPTTGGVGRVRLNPTAPSAHRWRLIEFIPICNPIYDMMRL